MATFYADSGSFKDVQVTGSLTISQNLTVLGTSSITYITASQLNIQTNTITVNTATPAVRFGGLGVIDSGSAGTGLTGSILWDSQNNVWLYSNPSGSSYDGALILVGPRNSTGIGNEQGITTNYLYKGDGSHHTTSSRLFDDGTIISVNSNTQITGSLIVSNGITGSFSGSVVGYVPNTQTGSFILNTQTGSMSVATASFALNASAGGISQGKVVAIATGISNLF